MRPCFLLSLFVLSIHSWCCLNCAAKILGGSRGVLPFRKSDAGATAAAKAASTGEEKRYSSLPAAHRPAAFFYWQSRQSQQQQKQPLRQQQQKRTPRRLGFWSVCKDNSATDTNSNSNSSLLGLPGGLRLLPERSKSLAVLSIPVEVALHPAAHGAILHAVKLLQRLELLLLMMGTATAAALALAVAVPRLIIFRGRADLLLVPAGGIIILPLVLLLAAYRL